MNRAVLLALGILLSGCSIGRVVTDVRTARDGRLVVTTCDLQRGFPAVRLEDCADRPVETVAR